MSYFEGLTVVTENSSKREEKMPSPRASWLMLSKVQYITESYTANRYDVFKNYLRKNTENFILIPQKNCIVMPGPKRNKFENPPGLVIAYNSGNIVSIGNKEEAVGIGDANDCSMPYSDWVRKKFRSHNCEPTCKMLGNTRILNVLGRYDLPPRQEIYLEELHDFMISKFPEWKVIYDPELYPCMALYRLFGKRCSTKIGFETSPNTKLSYSGTTSNELKNDEKSHFIKTLSPVNMLLNDVQGYRYTYPDDAFVEEFRKREAVLLNDKAHHGFLNCELILGIKHIIIQNGTCKEEIERAMFELFPLLEKFIGTPEQRSYRYEYFYSLPY